MKKSSTAPPPARPAIELFSAPVGPTLPLRDLTRLAYDEQAKTAKLVCVLWRILNAEFPQLPPYTGGTTAAPAGTSVGANALIERLILGLRQDNEALEGIIGAMRQYIEGEADS